MNRGERRKINYRKWISRLKKCFYKEHNDFAQPLKSYDELKSDKYGVLLKNTGTVCSYKRLDKQEEHKRNIANRSLSKADEEELDIAVELMNNQYTFEEYCSACDNFGTDICSYKDKVTDMTKWKEINCNSFED